MYDVLLIGGGVSGMSCALVLGSAQNKLFVQGRKIGIFTHQKASSLQEALFNNAYGIRPGTLGSDLLHQSVEHLHNLYPHIQQIADEKVLNITSIEGGYQVETNKNYYESKSIVIAIGASSPFAIAGLEAYVIPHQKSVPEKNRIQLKNSDHKVAEGLYVAGTLAGWPSQLAIASGSGAAVATDLLTMWNGGVPVQVHDSIRMKG